MLIYIVRNNSKADRVRFSSFADKEKAFLSYPKARQQFNEWAGETESMFGALCGEPKVGGKMVSMCGDYDTELMTVEVIE